VTLCAADPSGFKASDASDNMDGENSRERQAHDEEGGQDNMADGSGGTRTMNSAEANIREREFECLRRERDLIARELEMLRLENVNLRNATAQRTTDREVPTPPDESSGSPLHRSVTRPVTTPLYQARLRPNINAICELLTEFKGTRDVY